MSPAERVRAELAAARAAGVPFDAAWTAALDALPAPPRSESRRRELEEWRTALHGAREAFRRAFECEPATPVERAVTLLARAFDT